MTTTYAARIARIEEHDPTFGQRLLRTIDACERGDAIPCVCGVTCADIEAWRLHVEGGGHTP